MIRICLLNLKEMKKIYIYNKCPEMENTAFYPEPAVKLTPKWWKKLPFLNDFNVSSRLGYGMDSNFLNDFKRSKNELKTSTIKGCPAVLDSISSGYILRAWCDIMVTVRDNYEITVEEAPMVNETNPEKGPVSYFDSQEMFISQEIIKGKSIPKLISPFYIKGDPGVSVLVTHPMYHFNQNWSTMPGIVCIDKYPINLKWMFNWIGEPGNYIIEYGTPLLQIIPIVRQKVKLEKTNEKIESSYTKCPVIQVQKFIKSSWEYLYKTLK